ncbi:S-formylglutathione hydrolase [Maribrevibacterium harenarium]|uniref:S-formylglutathione hydrolase n=1 Tax=Maribrevibacterium harenarium TaxID=2589817 RepID=A0A501WPR6_9GAMM|nr:S-formylglutathione hydrolase [Maribrevibacterium harenarium]TPE50330.1 S-formylglutathione hydrolase [Maribrevibacterium harenarium]
MELLSSTKVSGGWLKRYRHESLSVKGDMVFAIFLPAQAENANVPVLYWLSGLTCTDENFSQKAGAFKKAAELGLAIVMPDTSPRGTDYPGEHDSYDFGSAAGFYLNATVAPYSNTYHMYDYVVQELPHLVEEHFPVTDKRSISGHSMGGHGALICSLKNPGRYQSVSAFAPITNPTQCPWGEKAFTGYLGDDRETWKAWDSCELIATAQERLPLLVDQGEADNFLEEQLKPEALEAACEKAGHPLTLRRQPGYDHSYFFISTFIDDHLEHHAKALGLI